MTSAQQLLQNRKLTREEAQQLVNDFFGSNHIPTEESKGNDSELVHDRELVSEFSNLTLGQSIVNTPMGSPGSKNVTYTPNGVHTRKLSQPHFSFSRENSMSMNNSTAAYSNNGNSANGMYDSNNSDKQWDIEIIKLPRIYLDYNLMLALVMGLRSNSLQKVSSVSNTHANNSNSSNNHYNHNSQNTHNAHNGHGNGHINNHGNSHTKHDNSSNRNSQPTGKEINTHTNNSNKEDSQGDSNATTPTGGYADQKPHRHTFNNSSIDTTDMNVDTTQFGTPVVVDNSSNNVRSMSVSSSVPKLGGNSAEIREQHLKKVAAITTSCHDKEKEQMLATLAEHHPTANIAAGANTHIGNRKITLIDTSNSINTCSENQKTIDDSIITFIYSHLKIGGGKRHHHHSKHKKHKHNHNNSAEKGEPDEETPLAHEDFDLTFSGVYAKFTPVVSPPSNLMSVDDVTHEKMLLQWEENWINL